MAFSLISVAFSLISKETRCVHPSHLPAPLPIPPSVIFIGQNNHSHQATFQQLCQQLSLYKTSETPPSARPTCWPCCQTHFTHILNLRIRPIAILLPSKTLWPPNTAARGPPQR